MWHFLVPPLLPGTGAGAPAAALLLKEAVYNAAGLAACELYEYIDYDSWYSSQLLHEMSVADPGYKIVRRRVVSLLGCWVNVKMSAELLPSLYEALLLALHPREDIVVGCWEVTLWFLFDPVFVCACICRFVSRLPAHFDKVSGCFVWRLCACVVDVFAFAQSY